MASLRMRVTWLAAFSCPLALAAACQSTSGEPAAEAAGGESTSAAGDNGLGTASGGDGGRGGSESAGASGIGRCPEPVGDGGAPTASPSLGFGGLSKTPLAGNAVVMSVEADSMTLLVNDDEQLSFAWIGKPLSDYFAQGEELAFRAESLGISGMGLQLLSVVQSDSVTLAALDANAYTVLGTNPGASTVLKPAELPELRYSLRECCESSAALACDYSDLLAVVDEQAQQIARGSTVVVGSWAITNLHSSYVKFGESTWSLRATLVR